MIDYLYTYQNKIVSPSSGVSIGGSSVPPMTLRFQFIDESADFDPSQQTWYYLSDGTWTHVEGSVWDFYYPHAEWDLYDGTNYHALFGGTNSGSWRAGPLSNKYFNVISANLTGVSEAIRLFWRCKHLKSVCLFDTSKIEHVSNMFEGVRDLRYAPAFDFSGVKDTRDGFKQLFYSGTNANTYSLLQIPDLTLPTTGSFDFSSMFRDNRYANGGILNMYNKMKNIAGTFTSAFSGCGSDTVNGSIERRHIPRSWGGDQV